MPSITLTTDPKLISSLHHQCFEKGWKEKDCKEVMGEHSYSFVASDAEETPIGFMIAREIAGEAEILTIGVIPLHQGKGVATLLLDSYIESAKKNHIAIFFLEVSEKNTSAIKLYLKAGFTQEGLRKAYYHNKENALIMKKEL